jgi:copper chaperone CopZ
LEDNVKTTKYIILGFVGLLLILMTGLVVAENPDAQDLSRAVLKIDSLSCGGCFSTINAGLTPLEGYSGMGANLFRKLIAIDFVTPLTAQKISRTLSDMGYPGKLETVDVISQKESFAYLESKRTGFISGGGSCCSGKQGASDLTTAPSGSCCTLPGISQSTKKF